MQEQQDDVVSLYDGISSLANICDDIFFSLKS